VRYRWFDDDREGIQCIDRYLSLIDQENEKNVM
jgi:hypothetical protein